MKLALMNKIVIDSNIVFSALLNVNSRIGQILINGNKKYDFFAPEFVRFEIIQHQLKIKKLAKLSDNDFIELYELVMRNVSVLNHTVVPAKFYKNAAILCKDIDIDDSIFVAFAEFLKAKLWTGDKKLINGLTKKGFNRIVITEDLYQDFIGKSKK